MENTNNNKLKTFAIAGLLLILPTTYFFIAVLFKYGFGTGFLFDPIDFSSYNFFTDTAVIIFPLLALLINIIPLLDVNIKLKSGNLVSKFAIKLIPLNIIVSMLSSIYLIIIFAYGITENLMIR